MTWNPSFPYLERATKGDFGHEQRRTTFPKEVQWAKDEDSGARTDYYGYP